MDGEHVETVTDFTFWVPKSLQVCDCNHEIKKRLLGRKTMPNPDCILKSRDTMLSTKVHIVKAMVSSAIYGCENWTIKKAEH